MARGLLTLVAAGLVSSAISGAQWIDSSPHTVTFVGVQEGVALEVLDWGGKGPPLVLLAGLGDTAHIFDRFAPRLTDRFHVVGITRRGFGASSQSDAGYDIATLARDIRAVLDRLDLERPVLVGHSIAGDEMTAFASAFPDRASALVYLDAAYDRTHRPTEPGPDQQATDADLASASAYNAHARRTLGFEFPEGDLHAWAAFDTNGRMVRAVTSSAIYNRVLDGAGKPDYAHVRIPALAIYQPNDLRLTFPDYDHFDEANKERAKNANEEVRAWAERSIAQFRAGVVKGRVVVLNTGSHFIFLTNEAEVVGLIRDFLSNVVR